MLNGFNGRFDQRGVEDIDDLAHKLIPLDGRDRLILPLATNALRNTPPLGGVFRDFRLSGDGAEENTVDLKVNGATPFVDAARILALAGERNGVAFTVETTVVRPVWAKRPRGRWRPRAPRSRSSTCRKRRARPWQPRSAACSATAT